MVRDVHSSFTTASITKWDWCIASSALLFNTSLLRAASTKVHVDNVPGFLASKDDKILSSKGVKLDYGWVKNVNRSAVADKAIQELELEFLKIDPSGSSVSSYQLQQADDLLNSWIKNQGLSAMEIILQRDQNTGAQLVFEDIELCEKQKLNRLCNQPHSAKSKAVPSNAISNNMCGYKNSRF